MATNINRQILLTKALKGALVFKAVGKPVVPISYGNNAKSADLVGGTTTVSMDGGNSIAVRGCKFSASASAGDAGGDKKGVAYGTIEAEA